MWNKVKRVFKRKKKRDDNVISFDGGEIGLKDVLPFKLEPTETYPDGIRIKTKYIGNDMPNGHQWEVNGIFIYAEDELDAERKYLRNHTK